MSRLVTLRVGNCLALKALPENMGGLSALKSLLLVHLVIKTLPKSISGMSSLETLCIDDCLRLARLPSGIGALSSLKVSSSVFRV